MSSIAELSRDYGLPQSHVEVLDFQRQPSWRLEEAENLRRELDDNPYAKLKHRDPLVTRLAQFLFRWHNVIGETEAERRYNRNRYLSRKYADLLWTFPIADSGSDVPARLELEARLLTSQPTADIARKFQVPVRMVEVYQACFYEVRHRLPNRAYIMSHCLHSEARSIEDRTKELVVKLFAYFGGPLVMEPFLYDYPLNIPVPAGGLQLVDYFKAVFQQTMSRRGMFMSTYFAPTRFNVAELVSTVRQMHQTEDELSSAVTSTSDGAGGEVVQSILQAIEWTHGLDARKTAIREFGQGIVDSPRQLSADEKIELKLNAAENNMDSVRTWKYPPPNNKTLTHEGRLVEKKEEESD